NQNGEAARRLAAAMHRTMAEALLQQAAYRDARASAQEATRRVAEARGPAGSEVGDLDELHARLVTADVESALDPERWLIERPYQDALVIDRDDGSTFRGYLGLSEVARRRCNWQSASEHLQ